MKKTILFFGILMLAFSGIHAQSSTSTTNGKVNFLGTWDFIMLGVPDGDVSCKLILEEKEGKLSGFFKFDETEQGKIAIVNPVVKDSILTFNAPLKSYDVDFNLAQNKDGQLNGTLFNGMFTATGKRSEAVDASKAK